MPTIALTQKKRTRVDWCDYKRLSSSNWTATWCPRTKSFYAYGNVRTNGKRTTKLMHRIVLGLVPGDGKMVDHKNHDTLDNRHRNLRLVTNRQNCENFKRQSVYGVGVRRWRGRFCVKAMVNGNERHIGMYDSPEEARQTRTDFIQSHEKE